MTRRISGDRVSQLIGKMRSVLRSIGKRVLMRGGVPTHYTPVDPKIDGDKIVQLEEAWKNDALPMRQHQIVERQLARFRAGKRVDVFDAIVAAVGLVCKARVKVLEVGCSSGYHSEVLALRGIDCEYSGCDYSESFIALARQLYPDYEFKVADATKLIYDDGEFDVVISGCCLLHIRRYECAISEAVRVAREFVIFHRTPVVNGLPTQYFTKFAYGIETVEIHFNECDFLALLSDSGLVVVGATTIYEERDRQVRTALRSVRTYVCKKLS